MMEAVFLCRAFYCPQCIFSGDVFQPHLVSSGETTARSPKCLFLLWLSTSVPQLTGTSRERGFMHPDVSSEQETRRLLRVEQRLVQSASRQATSQRDVHTHTHTHVWHLHPAAKWGKQVLPLIVEALNKSSIMFCLSAISESGGRRWRQLPPQILESHERGPRAAPEASVVEKGQLTPRHVPVNILERCWMEIFQSHEFLSRLTVYLY